jgi:mannan endo-1,4-beta-mannosidase
MGKRRLGGLCCLVLSMLCWAGGVAPSPARGAVTIKGARKITLGATIVGMGSFPMAIDKYNRQVYPLGNGRVGAVDFYQTWEENPAFPFSTMRAVTSRGATPVITWSSCVQGRSNPACVDAAVAGGSYDDYLRQYAHAAAQYGKPFYLRFDHEMNGYWYPWHPGSNGNTVQSFIAMWRHVHTIFTQEGATNARWAWCPNVVDGADNFKSMYPGDAYVDDACLDGYNWGPIFNPGSWTSFTAEFARSYALMTALTNKPIIIGETASVDFGGDKAAWIALAFKDIPRVFPHIVAVIWFDAVEIRADWRVNSSSAALTAFQLVAASPLYQGRLP